MIKTPNTHLIIIPISKINQVKEYFKSKLVRIYKQNKGRNPLLSTIDICYLME